MGQIQSQITHTCKMQTVCRSHSTPHSKTDLHTTCPEAHPLYIVHRDYNLISDLECVPHAPEKASQATPSF